MGECIICNKANKKSVEHILPDSLGGKLTINSVCKKCNDKLGSKIDAKMLNDDFIVVMRYKFDIKNKDNQPVDIGKHFSGRLIDVGTKEKGIFKKQNLDGETKVYSITPTKDKDNIYFKGGKVFYNNISDLDTLIASVDKEIKSLGYENFDKDLFKKNVLDNSKCQTQMRKYSAQVYYNPQNYTPEFIKIIHEILCKLYQEKYIETSFANYLKKLLKFYMNEESEIPSSNYPGLECEMYISLENINNYISCEKEAHILLSRNISNNDILIVVNIYNTIIFCIRLSNDSELNFIDELKIVVLN